MSVAPDRQGASQSTIGMPANKQDNSLHGTDDSQIRTRALCRSLTSPDNHGFLLRFGRKCGRVEFLLWIRYVSAMPGMREDLMRVIGSRIFVVCLVSLALTMPTVALAVKSVQLPKPSYKGSMSVEAAMQGKKSLRNFSKTPLSLQEVSQILWATNGRLPADAISGATIKVTPSAGGLYPLDIFLISGQGTVEGLPEGIYMYKPLTNSLLHVASGDNRKLLAYASLSQMWIARAPAIVVIAATFARTTAKYSQRGIQYVFMEAGNANQNMYLQAAAMGLRMGTVGAFNDPQVAAVLKLPSSMKPLLVVPVGK